MINDEEPKKSFRKKSPYINNGDIERKFCIRECAREYIPAQGNMLQIYCPACDRVLSTRPIKNKPFKDE